MLVANSAHVHCLRKYEPLARVIKDHIKIGIMFITGLLNLVYLFAKTQQFFTFYQRNYTILSYFLCILLTLLSRTVASPADAFPFFGVTEKRFLPYGLEGLCPYLLVSHLRRLPCSLGLPLRVFMLPPPGPIRIFY